jgi:hypothetical protein
MFCGQAQVGGVAAAGAAALLADLQQEPAIACELQNQCRHESSRAHWS